MQNKRVEQMFGLSYTIPAQRPSGRKDTQSWNTSIQPPLASRQGAAPQGGQTMQEVKQYPAGTFSWVDLATTDAAAAKAFYTRLFGWEAHDMPAGPEGTYTMLTLAGKYVAGLYEMGDEQRGQGIPPHWLSYVSVDDIDAATEKVSALGGTVLAGPMDVMEAGRMAMIQDPTGASFALWQAGQHIGAALVNIPGTFSWNELATTDTEKASAFYSGLFGWECTKDDMPTGPYYTFKNQGRMGGGMLQMTEEWGDMPSNWSVYFSVEDCDATVQQARELGGMNLMDPFEIPEVGRFAVMQDPQGAYFTVIKAYVIDPPPGY
jgi:hypothetical protein